MAIPMAGCVIALSASRGLLVGEGDGRQRVAVDRAVLRHDPRTEAIDERLVGGPPGSTTWRAT